MERHLFKKKDSDTNPDFKPSAPIDFIKQDYRDKKPPKVVSYRYKPTGEKSQITALEAQLKEVERKKSKKKREIKDFENNDPTIDPAIVNAKKSQERIYDFTKEQKMSVFYKKAGDLRKEYDDLVEEHEVISHKIKKEKFVREQLDIAGLVQENKERKEKYLNENVFLSDSD